MRITTAADSLQALPDGTASQDDSADKGLFARLLQAQPENNPALPDHAVAAKAPASSVACAVKADATTTTASIDTAAPVAESTETPALPADDGCLDSAANPAATELTTASANTVASTTKAEAILAQLAATLAQASKANAATQQTVTAQLATSPLAEEKSAQVAATPTNSSTTTETADLDDASLSEPAEKTATRSKLARATPAAAKPESNLAASELPDANVAAAPANPAGSDETSANSDTSLPGNADAVSMNTSKTSNRVPGAQQLATAGHEVDPALTSAADEPLPAANPGNTNDSMTPRGLRLPQGGKSLPPAADASAASSESSLQQVFKGLADSANPLQNQAAAADTAALQANQNALNTAFTNSDSQQTGSTQQGVNGTTVPLSGMPGSATSALATSNAPSPAPLVMSSALAMHSSGWGDEAVQHIRWLKDRDQQSAEIQLHPAELGRLSITIDIKDGQASVQLVAGNAEAKELLEKSLPELRNLLAQQGMSLGDSGVAQHSGNRDTWPNRFNPPWFDSNELKPAELSLGKPALFRSAGGSHRIDQYV